MCACLGKYTVSIHMAKPYHDGLVLTMASAIIRELC